MTWYFPWYFHQTFDITWQTGITGYVFPSRVWVPTCPVWLLSFCGWLVWARCSRTLERRCSKPSDSPARQWGPEPTQHTHLTTWEQQVIRHLECQRTKETAAAYLLKSWWQMWVVGTYWQILNKEVESVSGMVQSFHVCFWYMLLWESILTTMREF